MIALPLCTAGWANGPTSSAAERGPLAASPWLQAAEAVQEPQGKQQRKRFSDEFLTLGTEQGLGGEDWQAYERSRTKDLIRSFIPPLLRPAVVGHAFVLPPNAWQVTVNGRATTIDGDDFFAKHDRNRKVFDDFRVNRQFVDLDIFYGFDLNKKYLHNFTARLNIPYQSSQLRGSINPNGAKLIDAFTEGDVGEVGDIGLFLKKKFIDQAEWPIQIAGALGIRFPTGSNSERYNDGGRIKVSRPDPTGTGAPPPPPLNMPLPIAMLAGAPRATTPFPFNNGIFNRFSDDGRLPTGLQPGTGSFSYFGGLFFTRVNQQDSIFGRSAFHLGGTHTLKFGEDGIRPGDESVVFGSFVKPIAEDLLALDLSFLAIHQSADKYRGTFTEPQPTDAAGNPVGGFGSATHITFRQVGRKSFSKGWTGFFAPSLILSPDPSIRFTASALIRVIEPELGPAPETVFRLAMEVIF